MATPSNPLSVADTLGGLPDQLKDETDEQRRKRLLLQQQRMALGPASMSLGIGVQ